MTDARPLSSERGAFTDRGRIVELDFRHGPARSPAVLPGATREPDSVRPKFLAQVRPRTCR